jgi:hypothetical protein
MKTHSITQGYTLGYGISPFQGLKNLTSATIKWFCHLLAWCGKVNSILPLWQGVENSKGYYYHILKDFALSGLEFNMRNPLRVLLPFDRAWKNETDGIDVVKPQPLTGVREFLLHCTIFHFLWP